jgi:hypothetical protein
VERGNPLVVKIVDRHASLAMTGMNIFSDNKKTSAHVEYDEPRFFCLGWAEANKTT